MNDWVECVLGDICSFAKERIDVNLLSEKNYISTENMLPDKNGIVEATSLPSVNSVSKYQKDDVLVSNIRPYFKKIWFASMQGGCSNDVLVFRSKLNCNSEFLYYILSDNIFFDYVTKTSKGTKMPRGDKNAIMGYNILLPPLQTQKKIASILSSLDDKIEINTRMNKVLEEIARALFHRWFVEFEFPDAEGRPYKSSGGKMVDSEMGSVPEGWVVRELDEISKEIICGKTPSTKVLEYYGHSIPFITIPDMHNQVYVTSTERYLSIMGANSQVKKTLPKNSICVSCIATPGLVSLTSVESQTNQQINSIICKDGISPYFVYLSMLNLSSLIGILGSGGSTTSNLNKTQFSKIKIIIPSKENMNKFDKIISPLFDNIKKKQIESQKVMKIRDSLLPKLMSGEIKV